ncbi:hypothetical protein L7F22_060226 [Adiantum nelumboides]|nr:hypothetical protein [Adiantum nelumboides]
MEPAAGCESGACIRSWLAVGACVVMAVLYVDLLYVPSLLLRLPPPASLRHHILRRFGGAIAATCLSLGLSYRLLLSIKIDSSEGKSLALWLDAFGVRSHHWDADSSNYYPFTSDIFSLLGTVDNGGFRCLQGLARRLFRSI